MTTIPGGATSPPRRSSDSTLLPAGGELRVLVGPDLVAPRDDIGVGPALLDEVMAGGSGGWLRVYRPAPTMAFSRMDALSPGFPRAVEVSAAHGFTPVLRAPGGRAAAYHEQALCIDLAVAALEPHAHITHRFVELADLIVEALGDLGVSAQVGSVPDEYCPGRFSVNSAGLKIVGTAQRVKRGGWCLGAVVLVDGAARVREVIGPVYEALGLHCDVGTVGALSDLTSGLEVDDVGAAVLAAFARRGPLTGAAGSSDLLERARRAAPGHPVLQGGSAAPPPTPRHLQGAR